jgi:hypothetical protein
MPSWYFKEVILQAMALAAKQIGGSEAAGSAAGVARCYAFYSGLRPSHKRYSHFQHFYGTARQS